MRLLKSTYLAAKGIALTTKGTSRLLLSRPRIRWPLRLEMTLLPPIALPKKNHNGSPLSFCARSLRLNSVLSERGEEERRGG